MPQFPPNLSPILLPGHSPLEMPLVSYLAYFPNMEQRPLALSLLLVLCSQC
jgi:hypothetical protein